MIKLALHLKYSFSKRNPPSIVLTYYDTAERGGWDRPLKHRGIWPMFVAERTCDHQEEENYRNSWRMRFINYDDWDLLIEDELRFPENPEWISKLRELKQKHSSFKRYIPYRMPEDTEPLKRVPSKIEIQDSKNGQLRLVFNVYDTIKSKFDL